MIICLSSGTRPRYKQDVLRALALPPGAQLQFRYDTKWVSGRVLKAIEDGSIVGQDVLIAYADQSEPKEGMTKEGPVELVPVRIGKIQSAAKPGSTVSIIFTVGRLLYASNLEAFNNGITGLSGGALARWVENKPTGLYCAELSAPPGNFEESDDLALWELIVEQLAVRPDFQSEETFITVVSLAASEIAIKKQAQIHLEPWVREMGADQLKDVTVYHYHPTKSPGNLHLKARCGPELRAESLESLRMDSRYDLKRFRIRSGDPALGAQGSWLTLTVEGDGATGPFELELRIDVQSNLQRRILVVGLIALSLTGAQVIPLVSRNDLSDADKIIALVGLALVYVAGAVAAVWGIPKKL